MNGRGVCADVAKGKRRQGHTKRKKRKWVLALKQVFTKKKKKKFTDCSAKICVRSLEKCPSFSCIDWAQQLRTSSCQLLKYNTGYTVCQVIKLINYCYCDHINVMYAAVRLPLDYRLVSVKFGFWTFEADVFRIVLITPKTTHN